MFHRRSFWIILVLTAVVWLMAAMSEHADYRLNLKVEWQGYDTSRYVVTYADTLLPLTVNSNCFEAISRYYTVKERPFVLRATGDTVINVGSRLFDSIEVQMGFNGVQSMSSAMETIRLRTTERIRKGFEPQMRDVDFQFAERRGLSGQPVIEPDTVWLYGSQASLDKIDEVVTQETVVADVADSGYYGIALQPVWEQYGDVSASHDSVRVFIPVDRYVEKTFTLPVKFSSVGGDYKARLLTDNAVVTLWVPERDYDQIVADMLEVVAEYNPAEQMDELPVQLRRFPQNTRVKLVVPESVQYVLLSTK